MTPPHDPSTASSVKASSSFMRKTISRALSIAREKRRKIRSERIFSKHCSSIHNNNRKSSQQERDRRKGDPTVREHLLHDDPQDVNNIYYDDDKDDGFFLSLRSCAAIVKAKRDFHGRAPGQQGSSLRPGQTVFVLSAGCRFSQSFNLCIMLHGDYVAWSTGDS